MPRPESDLPAGLSFGGVLEWLMLRGVRPKTAGRLGDIWTKKFLAEKVGCSERQVGNWLTGRSLPNPNLGYLSKIEEAFFGKDADQSIVLRKEFRDAFERTRLGKTDQVSDINSEIVGDKPLFLLSPIFDLDFRPFCYGGQISANSLVAVTVPIAIANLEPENSKIQIHNSKLSMHMGSKSYQFMWYYFVSLVPSSDAESSFLSSEKIRRAKLTEIAPVFSEEIMHLSTQSLLWGDFVSVFENTECPIRVVVFIDFGKFSTRVICQFDPAIYKTRVSKYPYLSVTCESTSHG